MTTPLSDADLKQIWARWEKGIETAADIEAAGDDIPHLLVEVERLRAENAGLQHLADCQADFVDGTATVNERLTARNIAQFRHWVALSDSTEDADEQRLLDAMLAASVPDLLAEVERLRGIVQFHEALAGLLDYLRQAFDPQAASSFTARYERMLRAEVLALDEVDKCSMTAWADEKLFELVDDRYRRASECLTLIATNQRLCDRDKSGKVTKTYSVLPESRHSGAIMSRLLDGRFLVVDMGDEDVRRTLDRASWLARVERAAIEAGEVERG